uniref:Calcium/calmodulin-dependent protein kinase II association-domain domain-containing protein n=1 Tax=Tetradesmus obliquus TaxID=3088 RepID=A0A383VB81_TETOB|eukprot:jgi/Sobl393_1/9687/SZX62461.1
MDESQQYLIKLSQCLLDSIANRDWQAYSELCDETLTAFEPEAVGHLVTGLPFHKFYFDLLAAREDYQKPNNTITQPHVRMLGDSAAVVSYVRLVQKIDAGGRPLTISSEETRVWEKKGGKWKNVHFHRSPTTPSS